MIDAFFAGVLAMYFAAGVVILGIVFYRRSYKMRAADVCFMIGTVLIWPLFVDHLLKRLLTPS